MTLRLSVVSEHGIRLGAHSTKVFGVHGGSIGRGTDNEWILPDPERYLSGKHARIEFRAGSYILSDISSNGTYVNGAQVPLGKYHTYTLKDGDYVRLGEYELLVSIDKSNDFPPDQSAIVAYDGRSASSAVKKSTADDIGADLDLSQLLELSDHLDVSSRTRARNSYGQSVTPDWGAQQPTAATAPAGPEPHALDDILPTEENPATPWHMMTRPLKMEPKAGMPATGMPAAGSQVASSATTTQRTVAAGAREKPAPVLFEGELDAGVAAFCRGAGIDARALTPEARSAALQLAGQLLRESVLGLMDLMQNRSEFRARFRIAAPAEEGPDSPLNLARGVDDALMRLLSTSSVRARSVESLRDHFKECKAQNAAVLAAMRTAFEAFLERVDPKDLEDRFDRAGKRSVFGTPNKGKYWDLYAELFPGLAQRPADGFPHVFEEAFVTAYEAKLRSLVPPRRSSFGADRIDPIEPDDRAVGDF